MNAVEFSLFGWISMQHLDRVHRLQEGLPPRSFSEYVMLLLQAKHGDSETTLIYHMGIKAVMQAYGQISYPPPPTIGKDWIQYRNLPRRHRQHIALSKGYKNLWLVLEKRVNLGQDPCQKAGPWQKGKTLDKRARPLTKGQDPWQKGKTLDKRARPLTKGTPRKTLDKRTNCTDSLTKGIQVEAKKLLVSHMHIACPWKKVWLLLVREGIFWTVLLISFLIFLFDFSIDFHVWKWYLF